MNLKIFKNSFDLRSVVNGVFENAYICMERIFLYSIFAYINELSRIFKIMLAKLNLFSPPEPPLYLKHIMTAIYAHIFTASFFFYNINEFSHIFIIMLAKLNLFVH